MAQRPYVYVARKDGIDVITTEPPNLSGIVTFDWYPVDIDSSDPANLHPYVDYSRGFVRPIRGAIVELHDESDVVIAKTNTTIGGYYAFHAPPNANLKVVVTAQLGAPRNPEVRVEDRTPSVCVVTDPDCHLYKVKFDVTTTNERVTKDYVASTEWNNGYGARDGAPFAILDTVYQAKVFVRGVDPNRTYPLLTLDWGPTLVQNSDHTPFFDPATKRITLNGLADVDTDEYDTMVVLHEFGHFVQDTVGRDDGLGGSHALTDHLDPPTAFSEGFATAFAGVVANADRSFADTNICDASGCAPASGILDTDTSGPQQAGVVCFSAIDTDESSCPDPRLNLKGFDSETGIASLIWNLSAGTTTNLGLDSVYTALNRTTASPAFASVFTFVQKLKELRPASLADITALAATKGIVDGDEFDAVPRDFYFTFQIGNAVGDFVDFDTSDANGKPSADSPGNDLFNWVYLKFDVPQPGGCFSLTLDPRLNPDHSTPKLVARLARPGLPPLPIIGAPGISVPLQLTAGTHSVAVGAYMTSSGVTTAHFRMRILADSSCVP